MKRLALVFIITLMARGSAIAESGREIIDASGIKGGLVVHLGCGDGKLTAELRINDSYIVQALDTDVKQMDKARKNIQSLGIYGNVSADTFDGVHLPYIDNIVNLVVAKNLGKASMDEVMRLAGHSKYDTTLRYYLVVNDDLVDKARRAIKHRVSREMLERCLGRKQ